MGHEGRARGAGHGSAQAATSMRAAAGGSREAQEAGATGCELQGREREGSFVRSSEQLVRYGNDGARMMGRSRTCTCARCPRSSLRVMLFYSEDSTRAGAFLPEINLLERTTYREAGRGT